ncbi:6-phosphofructokinase [Candidatus Bathyarchaeota archaeon]|nr:6-phosphofructokinase [Candidatus Bathyarchaeota archaeon]
MKIGVLTGGGDCPGLNAVIEAIVKRANQYGYEVIGFLKGYAGLINNEYKPLIVEEISGIFSIGGTILGTSRVNPFKREGAPQRITENIKRHQIDALIVIGGDDTLGAAYKLYEMGLPIVGVPKTIDNDISEVDYSVGFMTAVETIAQAMERLHTTAKSHERVMIVEVMGRYTGWLTLMGGIAGGAHIILVPEKPFKIEEVCRMIREREEKGKKHTIIAVAEGAKPENIKEFITISKECDEFGHVRLGGIAKILEKEIAKRTGKETRSVVLGHVQRGGSPNAFDRILGIRLGICAVDLIREGKFGHMVCLRGTKIVAVKMESALKQKKLGEEEIQLIDFFRQT